MTRKIVIACRDTRPGLQQAQQVSNAIKAAGYLIEIQPFKDPDISVMLSSTSIDVAVTSADLLPVDLPDELELIGATQRKHVHNVVLSLNKNQTLAHENLSVGVSSPLRSALVKHYYPSANPMMIDSIETLLNKLSSSEINAAVVSHHEAILNDAADYIVEPIETSYFTPACGQGTTAVLCYKKLDYRKKEVIQQWVNHEETEDCVRAERSFLKELPPANNILPFSYALYQGALITLKAGAISTDGKDIFKAKRSTALGESRDLGKKVASEVLRLISEHSVHAF